jgi:hypothetical protein
LGDSGYETEYCLDGQVPLPRRKRWLKWENTAIGVIDESNSVTFTLPALNSVVSIYTHGEAVWTPDQFQEFLSERIVDGNRRDIERILNRCGLAHYDVIQLGEITRGIHSKDLFWIARQEDERLEDAYTDAFKSIFCNHIDISGKSLDSPEGFNIKRYGACNGKYGIYKQRINPLTTDAESEVAVFLLAKKLGIPCCPAYRTGKDTVFSVFLHDFAREYIVHFRRLVKRRTNNEYQNILSVRPQYKEEYIKMILLDFITRQDDRHLSNFAVKVSPSGESFYPLYDNGRSLFYEDTEEMVSDAISDPIIYATAFGQSGTFWDHILDISKTDRVAGLINLGISREEVLALLKEAGFAGYRLEGASIWISKAINMIAELR